ncbi:MAG TPA: hypothetical protein VF824_00865 [Thermoanaerobaculia bacterium]|jgi:hypothetical protein
MNLSKLSKILVLVVTLVPPVYMALLFATFLITFSANNKEPAIFKHFGLFFVVHLCVMLLTFALLTFYIVVLFKTDRVKPELKALWAVVLFFGGPIAMPIFWYLHVWSKAPSTIGSVT